MTDKNIARGIEDKKLPEHFSAEIEIRKMATLSPTSTMLARPEASTCVKVCGVMDSMMEDIKHGPTSFQLHPREKTTVSEKIGTYNRSHFLCE
jgi:hypothetical protein